MSEAVQWLLKAIPTYVVTFGRVFVAPKTEILEKCKGAESAVPGALLFLGVSQLVLYPLAEGWLAEVSKQPHSEFGLPCFALFHWASSLAWERWVCWRWLGASSEHGLSSRSYLSPNAISTACSRLFCPSCRSRSGECSSHSTPIRIALRCTLSEPPLTRRSRHSRQCLASTYSRKYQCLWRCCRFYGCSSRGVHFDT